MPFFQKKANRSLMTSKQQFFDMFHALDSQGVEGLFPYLRDDIRFRFASYPEVTGQQSIAELWNGMSAAVSKLEHHLDEILIHETTVFCYGTVTYHLHQGNPVCVPFANRFVITEDKISEYHSYVDASAVLGAAPSA